MTSVEIEHRDFVFVDLGSGKGRTLLLASEWPFKKVVGVEFSVDLHRIAEDNIRKLQVRSGRCRDVVSVCMDATDYRLPVDPAVLYFYHPFQADVMTRVVEHIERSLRECPRELYILYYNPVCARIFDKSPAFRRIRTASAYLVYGAADIAAT
jgi:SAM-dependent methyltransferase